LAQEKPLDVFAEQDPNPVDPLMKLVALKTFRVFLLQQQGQTISSPSPLKVSFSNTFSQASH
jgi:hypothetical protein